MSYSRNVILASVKNVTPLANLLLLFVRTDCFTLADEMHVTVLSASYVLRILVKLRLKSILLVYSVILIQCVNNRLSISILCMMKPVNPCDWLNVG
jgi:hypothetical protein